MLKNSIPAIVFLVFRLPSSFLQASSQKRETYATIYCKILIVVLSNVGYAINGIMSSAQWHKNTLHQLQQFSELFQFYDWARAQVFFCDELFDGHRLHIYIQFLHTINSVYAFVALNCNDHPV